jgi:hypothetical protein
MKFGVVVPGPLPLNRLFVFVMIKFPVPAVLSVPTEKVMLPTDPEEYPANLPLHTIPMREGALKLPCTSSVALPPLQFGDASPNDTPPLVGSLYVAFAIKSPVTVTVQLELTALFIAIAVLTVTVR